VEQKEKRKQKRITDQKQEKEFQKQIRKTFDIHKEHKFLMKAGIRYINGMAQSVRRRSREVMQGEMEKEDMENAVQRESEVLASRFKSATKKFLKETKAVTVNAMGLTPLQSEAIRVVLELISTVKRAKNDFAQAEPAYKKFLKWAADNLYITSAPESKEEEHATEEDEEEEEDGDEEAGVNETATDDGESDSDGEDDAEEGGSALAAAMESVTMQE